MKRATRYSGVRKLQSFETLCVPILRPSIFFVISIVIAIHKIYYLREKVVIPPMFGPCEF